MANETPESDFSIECFQNYTAPEVFVQGLAGMVDQSDVATIIQAQKNMLQRFEKTTEMLYNCNQLSMSRLRAASGEFKRHTTLLLDMKKDLEFIFKKIRAIKTKLSTQYPEAYKAAVNASLANRTSIDEEEEQSDTLAQSKMVATVSTETLKPASGMGKKNKKKGAHLDESSASGDINRQEETEDKNSMLVKEDVKRKIKKSSSSSETESASSGDECSTDTG